MSEGTLNSTAKDEIEFLKNVPILCDLEPMDLETIGKVGVRKKYKKGSIILLEEEAGAALFVIVSGKVKKLDPHRVQTDHPECLLAAVDFDKSEPQEGDPGIFENDRVQ